MTLTSTFYLIWVHDLDSAYPYRHPCQANEIVHVSFVNPSSVNSSAIISNLVNNSNHPWYYKYVEAELFR